MNGNGNGRAPIEALKAELDGAVQQRFTGSVTVRKLESGRIVDFAEVETRVALGSVEQAMQVVRATPPPVTIRIESSGGELLSAILTRRRFLRES